MRTLAPLVSLVIALPFLSPAPARGDAFPAPEAAQTKRPSLQVSIDRSRVDLSGHKLEVKLSRAADKVRLKVYGQSGAVLAEVEKSFNGAAAGTALETSWTPSSEEAVGKIEVWGYDTDGFFSGVAITAWNASIDHDDVNFETDSDVIRPTEAPKLEASLRKIADVLSKRNDPAPVTLYVLGHTDTVGTPEHNLTLSRRRARAIAAWFKGHGLKIAAAYEGMGQGALLVKTGDQVDEPRNRRATYELALYPPKLSAGSWSPL